EVSGIPISYMSVNDLFNLINELRTFPDIDDYLKARTALPKKVLRTVGEEKPLFEYYLLSKRSFEGCHGHDDARIVAAAKELDLDVYNHFKPLKDRFAGYVECISDRLATRLKEYDRNQIGRAHV